MLNQPDKLGPFYPALIFTVLAVLSACSSQTPSADKHQSKYQRIKKALADRQQQTSRSRSYQPQNQQSAPIKPRAGRVKTYRTNRSTQLQARTGESATLTQLKQHYYRWQGTPYRLGGNGPRGIDCSALVMRVMDKAFNTRLPRTTRAQSKSGHLITHASLKAGDLVFFKTDSRTLHVGIYLQRQEFMHASTSNGVMISRLDEPYWRQRYWMSRRVL